MLIQAQARRGAHPITPGVVKQMLMADFQVPEEQIKIATGTEWQLDGIDLANSLEPSRFIITVQALREGWDCPNAYVLCTLGHSNSATAVEQILGRILRLPDAKEKADKRLNRAYAFASSTSFRDTANALAEALVSNGFERMEAAKLIHPADAQLALRAGALASDAVDAEIDLTPFRPIVAAATAGRVSLDTETRQFTATDITAADAGQLRLLMPELLRPALESLLARHEAMNRPRPWREAGSVWAATITTSARMPFEI